MKWAGILAALAVVLHFWEYNGALAITRNLKIDYQKAISLQTENGFYYSFYDDLAHAPSTFQGMKDIVFDTRSEHPHTINALSRFNIWQEIFLGLAYRAFGFLLIQPYYFYQIGLMAFNALGQGMLVYMASIEGGSIGCGIVTMLGLFLNRPEISRIYNINCLCLREFWGLPALWIQIYFVLQATKGKDTGKGFILSTCCFLLFWQFGSYILNLQVSAVFLVHLLGLLPGGTVQMRRIIDCYMLGTWLTIAFLVGNWLLVTNLFLSVLLAVRLSLFIPSSILTNRITRFWIPGIAALVIFLCIRMLMKPFADADTHIFEMICARSETLKKYGGKLCEGEASFNARLYLVMDVFRTIDQSSLDFYLASGAGYACFATICLIAVIPISACVSSFLPGSGHATGLSKWSCHKKIGEYEDGNMKMVAHENMKMENGKTAKGNEKAPDTDVVKKVAPSNGCWIYLGIQFVLFFIMGYFVNRLRAVFGPPMILMAALAFSPKLLSSIHPRIPPAIGHALVWLHVAYIATKMPCVDDSKAMCGIVTHWTQNEADVVEFSAWINKNLNATDALATSMNLGGTLRALAKTRTIIHPHFEDRRLRLRVQDLYEDLYHCLSPKHAAEKLKALDARYIVIEWKRCLISPYKLDPPRKSCVQGDPNVKLEDLFCRKIFFEPAYFQLRFSNGGVAMFERMDGNGLRKKFVSFHDEELWTHVADQCTDKDACGGRLAEAAIGFDERMRAKGAGQILMNIVAKRYQDGISKYYQARYLDYNMKQEKGVAELYKQAWKKLPNNPLIAKEYILFMEIVVGDSKTALEVATSWLKQEPGNNVNYVEYWEMYLESAVSILKSKKKKGQQMWEEMKVSSPRVSTVEQYWSWFSKENYTHTLGTGWAKFRNIYFDFNLRCGLQSFASTSARTINSDEWVVLHSD